MRTSPESPLYRPILADAFRIAWSHKHLWLYGFFAGMAGFGGATDAFLGSYDVSVAGGQRSMGDSQTVQALMTDASGSPMLAAVAAILTVAFLAAFVWMTTVSIGALVDGVRKISRGGEPHFSDTLEAGRAHFWRVLGTTVLSRTVALLCYGAIGITMVAFLRDRSPVSVGFFLLGFVACTAAAVLASVAGAFSTILVVAKDKPFTEAVRDGVRHTLRHWLTSVEMAILLAFSAVAFTAVAIVPVAMLSIPLIFAIVIASFAGAQTFTAGIIALSALMLVAAVIALSAFFSTFQTAAWMLLWEETAEGRGMAKLARVVRKFSRRK